MEDERFFSRCRESPPRHGDDSGDLTPELRALVALCPHPLILHLAMEPRIPVTRTEAQHLPAPLLFELEAVLFALQRQDARDARERAIEEAKRAATRGAR